MLSSEAFRSIDAKVVSRRTMSVPIERATTNIDDVNKPRVVVSHRGMSVAQSGAYADAVADRRHCDTDNDP